MWLKSPRRVASLLWLYFVVELVQALVEREVRQEMRAWGLRRLNLYPEGRGSAAPTAGLVFSTLEGHRRHRLFGANRESLPGVLRRVAAGCRAGIELLGVDGAALRASVTVRRRSVIPRKYLANRAECRFPCRAGCGRSSSL